MMAQHGMLALYLCDFSGNPDQLLRKPIFCDFSGGGGSESLSPPLDPRMIVLLRILEFGIVKYHISAQSILFAAFWYGVFS